MKIEAVRIRHYKGFRDTNWVELADGVNVLVGQNNSGKSAFLEAFRVGRFSHNPHRSPIETLSPTKRSAVQFRLKVQPGALNSLALSNGSPLLLAVPSEHSTEITTGIFKRFASEELRFAVEMVGDSGQFVPISNPPHGLFDGVPFKRLGEGKPDADRSAFEGFGIHGASGSTIVDATPNLAWQHATQSIFVFDTQRYSIGRCEAGSSSLVLESNARNLPVMLSGIKNPKKFEEIKAWVRRILPMVKDISAPTVGRDVEINIFIHDTDRGDLAIPLDNCGSGIAQVLAIAFIVLTYSEAVIVIDEPNSFLHPGATKKLMEFLRQFPRHQFVVSTHSPEVISALSPDRLLLTSWNSNIYQSAISTMEGKPIEDLRAVLGNIGASLSDVFGSDAVIWVEGATEEICFPMLIDQGATFAVSGAKFVSMRNASAFGSKRRNLQELFDIYERASTASALLPPAAVFSFDREKSTETEREDLVRASKGRAKFLPRPMYENYILHGGAIAAILQELDPVGSHTEDEVRDQIEKCLPIGATTASCDAAKLIEQIFNELTVSRVRYDKTHHAPILTRWLLDNEKSALQDLIDYVDGLVPSGCKVPKL